MEVTISGGNTGKPINMRSSSTTQSKIITQIPQGSTATLIREDGAWDKIQYQTFTGYVMAEFVHKDQPGPEPDPGDTVSVSKAELQAVYDTIGGWLGLRG